ncbi:MAG: transglutaminase-like domain-containing protein [Pseudomonadota bacterium]
MKLEGEKTVLKIVVIVCWIILFTLLLKRDYLVERLDLHEAQVMENAEKENFVGVYFQQERIGFVKNRLVHQDTGLFTLNQQATLNLTVLGKNYPVEMEVDAHLTPAFLLRDFKFSLSSPFYAMKAQGEVHGNTVQFVLENGKEKIRDSVTLTSPPLLSLNHRGYLLRENLRSGDKVKIGYFDPLSLSGKDVLVEYKGLEKKLVKGRIQLLHHFEEIFSGIRISSWLDESGKVVMEESPSGFVFISEPEFKATSISRKGTDILQSVAVSYDGGLDDIAGRDRISFRLELPDDVDFDLNGGRQQWRNGVLAVSREKIDARVGPECAGASDQLEATPYIQASHAQIMALAGDITRGIDSPLDRVRALLRWIFDNIDKRPVIGIPDAVTTLRTRIGDCNEHAVLFAALARSAGIPTRIAAGVTWHEGAFFYHAWNEVCLGGEWISLDTTKNQLPADLTHIRFVIGETKEQIRIGALLGKLRILPVDDADTGEGVDNETK